jgi:hypothetical protein
MTTTNKNLQGDGNRDNEIHIADYFKRKELNAIDILNIFQGQLKLGNNGMYEFTESEIKLQDISDRDYEVLIVKEQKVLLEAKKDLYLKLPCTPKQLVTWVLHADGDFLLPEMSKADLKLSDVALLKKLKAEKTNSVTENQNQQKDPVEKILCEGRNIGAEKNKINAAERHEQIRKAAIHRFNKQPGSSYDDCVKWIKTEKHLEPFITYGKKGKVYSDRRIEEIIKGTKKIDLEDPNHQPPQ